MKVIVEKLAKKFGLNIVNNNYGDIAIKQFAGIHSIAHLEEGDVAAVVKADEDIKGLEERINLIVVTDVENWTSELEEKFTSYNKPVLWTQFSKREMISTLDSYALRKQQTPVRLHATMLSIFGEGVLIMGKSGIGKSEVALELVNRKHLFIGDDAIDVISFAGQPQAKAPRMSRDFIEVRGVGIVNIKGMYGLQSMVKEHKVDLIIELVNLDDVKSSVERLGREYSSKVVSGVEIPLIQVPVSSGRAIAPVIETATIAFKQRKQDNYIAANDLTERLKNS